MSAVMTLTKEIATEKENEKDALFRTSPVLEIKNLSISLYEDKGGEEHRLVKKLNLSIRPGEMLGLAGESGSGKSLTASAILGLLPKSLSVSEGQILIRGQDLLNLSEKEMGHLRGKEIAYIFQNYQDSFTPFIKIGRQLVEALRSHDKISKPEAKKQALLWLERVKLPAEQIFSSYPHQLSGGQLQRASLAAALMFEPVLIIADEPTTALDVLTGEKVLDLLAGLQKELNCAVLLVSHDLKHVLKRTDSMAVMYGGQIVEKGATKSLRENPRHPYTKLLLKARPILRYTALEKFAAIPGEPGLIAKEGCTFALRCPLSFEQCYMVPAMQPAGRFQWTACQAVDREKVDTNA
ncbi:ABC transporter ATP-binding protein [Domibacillus epiphyticus]|uniref:ABC transporter domain-containing protein n=1 Tax=Domibacillus epiphyticus TaxID=1714355 RepID=A0A1V2A5H8_9BACI|nr:ABC transporter ATP-binding protein [Domibacillus epiphyticus]OMP66269.1 hypothetical protein BTO28_13315 [Domibacillus epiphyticus]